MENFDCVRDARVQRALAGGYSLSRDRSHDRGANPVLRGDTFVRTGTSRKVTRRYAKGSGFGEIASFLNHRVAGEYLSVKGMELLWKWAS